MAPCGAFPRERSCLAARVSWSSSARLFHSRSLRLLTHWPQSPRRIVMVLHGHCERGMSHPLLNVHRVLPFVEPSSHAAMPQVMHHEPICNGILLDSL